jgi:drug/metabolite transporter (DMT)-like permease
MTSERARGIWLSLITVVCWSLLPITLRIASHHVDPYTLTWYRFFVSALLLGAILAVRAGLPPLASVRVANTLAFVLVATLGLVGNYVLYLVSLSYVSPTFSTVITQLGPLLLLLGGVVLFHEHLGSRQALGVLLLVVGLFLFFNRRLVELMDLKGRAGEGAVICLAAAVVWAIYGLAQKVLLHRFTSAQILLLIYVGASVVLAPFVSPLEVRQANGLELFMLLLCCLNTLVAYGALAEALKHTGASIVGAVLAVGPVASLIVTWASNRVSPGFFAPDLLNVATIAGAVAVTVGSALTASRG